MDARRIISISYDVSGMAVHDATKMEGKHSRHADWKDASFLGIVWGPRSEAFAPIPSTEIVSLRAPLHGFRPLCDLLVVFAAPYIALRRRERPERTVVYEFPLVWAAAAIRLVVGGRVELRLTTLPTELARTFGRFHRFYYRFHEVLVWRLVDDFVVMNEATRQYVLRLGAAAERIRIQAPDTIARDAAYIRAAKKGVVRQRYHIPRGRHVILSVGRLEVEKGYPELLELFARSGIDAVLVIVGDGSMRAELEAQARSLGISDRVFFAGWQERSEIWNFYADADVFVLLSRSESLGVVFWEAMSMRVPVMGRPIGGIPESLGVDGERGYLWETADGPEAFATKLRHILERGEDTNAMVTRAKVWVDRATEVPMVDLSS